jgi:hypothetical protein
MKGRPSLYKRLNANHLHYDYHLQLRRLGMHLASLQRSCQSWLAEELAWILHRSGKPAKTMPMFYIVLLDHGSMKKKRLYSTH